MTEPHDPPPVDTGATEQPDGPLPTVPHVGMVAIVGRTNAGKSTLVNRILGEKISIVSPIVQTTRHVIRGILTKDEGQMVLLDTPGLHEAQTKLGVIMNKAARTATIGTDAIILLLDRSVAPHIEDEQWMERLAKSHGILGLVLNKSDLTSNYTEAYQTLWTTLTGDKPSTATWFSISADTNEGVEPLLNFLWAALPSGPLLFPEEVLTDFPRKIAIGDLIREKLIRDLYGEIPHSLAVWIDSIEEDPVKGWHVNARVYLDRPGQKPIVIGNKGRHIKMARDLAEKDLSKIYGCRVTVELDIKIEKDWQKNHWILRQLGYVGM